MAVGPLLRIGNNLGPPISGNFIKLERFGLKEVRKNFSHSGRKSDKSKPGSVIVLRESFPLKSNIRYRPSNVIQSLILGISLSLDIRTLTPAGMIKGTPALFLEGRTFNSAKSTTL